MGRVGGLTGKGGRIDGGKAGKRRMGGRIDRRRAGNRRVEGGGLMGDSHECSSRK
jgi:hypothetical protein